MKYKLPDSFTMQIVNNKIDNLNEILSAINEEENYEILKEYHSFLTTNIIQISNEELNIILNQLNEKIIILEQDSNEFLSFLDRIHATYVEYDEAIKLISKYINKEQLSEEESLKIYAFLSNAITMFEYEYNESLEHKEKELLHYAMNYVRQNNSAIERHLTNRYDKACLKDKETTKKTNSHTKRLLNPDIPLLLDDNGASLTIIIITATILLGALIAAILLVK